MTGAKHLTPKECDRLPERIREFLSLCEHLASLKQKHAEMMGKLAHDLGEKKVAINWGGGQVIESDGRTVIKVIHQEIEIVT